MGRLEGMTESDRLDWIESDGFLSWRDLADGRGRSKID